MNKFLKRISIVGLLFSTSCVYSAGELTGLALEACVNLESGDTLCQLESDYELSCDVTVGILPNGYMLGKDENTIHTVFASCNKTKNAWSTDGKDFNIIAVDGSLYKFNDNKTEIFASNINSVVLYKQDSKTGIWHETDTPTGNEVIVMDFTGDNSDFIMINNAICNKNIFLSRNDSNYTWDSSKLKPAQFDFNAKNLTLSCSKKIEKGKEIPIPSTFRVAQFGEVSCPSGSTLTLSPTNDVESVLLLEPGSKVGSSGGTQLVVDSGIIDLSKYFKDENSLNQGQNIYMSLTQEQVSIIADDGLLNTTSKIKLFDTEEELINLKNTMKIYNSSVPVFKNILLNNSKPLFTKTSIGGILLNNSIVTKLFNYGDDSSKIVQKLQEEAIEEIFNNASESPITIDVSDLVGTSEESTEPKTMPPSILKKILENKNVTLSGNEKINLDFSEISNDITSIELSQIISNNFNGTMSFKNLPDNIETISINNLDNVKLEFDNIKIKEIQSNQPDSIVSISGTGTIEKLDVISSSCLKFTQGSNIKIGSPK